MKKISKAPAIKPQKMKKTDGDADLEGMGKQGFRLKYLPSKYKYNKQGC